MKKQTIYYRTTSSRRMKITPKEFEALRERYIKVFSSDTSDVIKIETANKKFDSEINQFEVMLKSMKKYGIETLLMIDKKRISENDEEVYLMCKLVEENGIELQFFEEKMSAKDVIREYEKKNNMTGMEMNQ